MACVSPDTLLPPSFSIPPISLIAAFLPPPSSSFVRSISPLLIWVFLLLVVVFSIAQLLPLGISSPPRSSRNQPYEESLSRFFFTRLNQFDLPLISWLINNYKRIPNWLLAWSDLLIIRHPALKAFLLVIDQSYFSKRMAKLYHRSAPQKTPFHSISNPKFFYAQSRLIDDQMIWFCPSLF